MGILKQIEEEDPYLLAEAEVVDEVVLEIPDEGNECGGDGTRTEKIYLWNMPPKRKAAKELISADSGDPGLKNLRVRSRRTYHCIIQISRNFWINCIFGSDMIARIGKLVNETGITDIKDEIRLKVKRRVDQHQRNIFCGNR